MKCRIEVAVDHEMIVISAPQGENLLDLLKQSRIPINSNCEGMGSCTTCRVFITRGSLSDPTAIEKERSEERSFLSTERLSCQSFTVGDCTIEIPSPDNQS